MPNIHLQNISKHYGAGQAAVRELDLSINDGEFMCLLGPSGCGKTTTLRLIAGLENLSSGRIDIDGQPVDSPNQGCFVPPNKRQLGMVFQSYALWPHLTVRRNVEFGLRLQKKSKTETRQASEAVMATLAILEYADRYPSQLSGGQQQRVALARMLVTNPRILLMDEPLSNLDARLRLQMRNELLRIHQQYQSTLVFVTHDQWEAMALATRIAVMNQGVIQQVGTPSEIYDRPANRFVAEFIGTPPINMIELGDGSCPFRQMLARVLPAATVEQVHALGIRPEHIQVQSSNDRSGLTVRFESEIHTGAQSICELSLGPHRLLMARATALAMASQSRLSIAMPTSAWHCFDRDGLRMSLPTRSESSRAAVTAHPPSGSQPLTSGTYSS